MSALAPIVEAFFTQRLAGQLQASPNTIAAYRDAFRLLLRFVDQHTGKSPSQLDIADLDAPLIGAFLHHLEHERGDGPRTRNARLAAIRSLFRYAALHHPEHAALIQRVLAMPNRRHDHAVVSYLTPDEIHALVAAPTPPPASGGATTRCCWSPSRPACGSPSSLPCGAATSSLAPERTSAATARDAKSAPPP